MPFMSVGKQKSIFKEMIPYISWSTDTVPTAEKESSTTFSNLLDLQVENKRDPESPRKSRHLSLPGLV